MIEAVPEFADGGYWYVLPVVMQRGAMTPGNLPVQWCAVYGNVDGVDYAFIRTPTAFAHPDFIIGVAAQRVIEAAALQGYLPQGFTTKPVMRVGGL